MAQDGDSKSPAPETFRTVDPTQNAKFQAVAESMRRQMVALLVKNLELADGEIEANGIVSGMMAGAAEVLWITKPNGGSLERVLEFWRFAGETHIKQFFADDTMGPTQGGTT